MTRRQSEMARGGVVGVGYEGRSVVEFVTDLRRAGVQIVVDARLVPRCSRRGFSRHALSEALRSNGVQYVHYEELGNPDPTQSFRSAGDAAAAADRYRAHLAGPSARAVIRDLLAVACSRRVGVLTAEGEAGEAQQAVLLGEIERARPDSEDIDDVLAEFGSRPAALTVAQDGRDRLERDIDALLAEFS